MRNPHEQFPSPLDEIVIGRAQEPENGERDLHIVHHRCPTEERGPPQGHASTPGESIFGVLPLTQHESIGKPRQQLPHVSLVGTLVAERRTGRLRVADDLAGPIGCP